MVIRSKEKNCWSFTKDADYKYIFKKNNLLTAYPSLGGSNFFLSLQPATTSSEVSRGVGEWLVETFAPFLSERLEAMPVEQLEFLHTLLRKAGHFSEFFVLGVLAMLSVLQTKLRYRRLSALFFCVLVAAVDETIQLFVSGRSGQVTDVVLDSVGALCGIVVFVCVRKIFVKKTC